MSVETIYLSRRNLMMLLSKLDRRAEGEASSCTIIKYQNPGDPFVQTMDTCAVTAVEDSEFYASRAPGPMHPTDEVNVATQYFQNLMDKISFPTPDVHTRDAPTSELRLDFQELQAPNVAHVHVGFDSGAEARIHFKLDEVEDQNKLIFVLPSQTYSVSQSFLRGLLDPTLEKFEDEDQAFARITVESESVILNDAFAQYIERFYIERSLRRNA